MITQIRRLSNWLKSSSAPCRSLYNPRMARIVEMHPTDPQPRRIAEVVAAIRAGGLVAYPTDSSGAFGCHIGDKWAMDRIRRIRQTDKQHNFTLVCSDLSEISLYARVDNWAYRLLKSLTPGPYTFILQATREVPNRLQHPNAGLLACACPITRLCMPCWRRWVSPS